MVADLVGWAAPLSFPFLGRAVLSPKKPTAWRDNRLGKAFKSLAQALDHVFAVHTSWLCFLGITGGLERGIGELHSADGLFGMCRIYAAEQPC
jgi:hypothetical protein